MSTPSPRGVAVFGSTGSIGTRTLDVIAAFPERFQVIALAAGKNVTLLGEQVRRFSPVFATCAVGVDRPDWPGVSDAPMAAMVTDPAVDIVVVGTSGEASLPATLAALRAGKIVALANKEILVMAGRLLTEAARAGGGSLRPVDSEHSAIWQCLWGERSDSVERLILTASGGAFRDLPPEDLARVTPAQALHHPTWKMGRKITVDCATLLNKGLETIEARWLFDVPMERIDVLMHRESIVHSLVEFVDGSQKAQLGQPDMRLPILCALSYPERLAEPSAARLDLGAVGSLHFAPPPLERYPCLTLAMAAGRRGGAFPAALIGAGDAAVEAFLGGRIAFPDMAAVIEDTLSTYEGGADSELEIVLAAEAWARQHAAQWIASRN